MDNRDSDKNTTSKLTGALWSALDKTKRASQSLVTTVKDSQFSNSAKEKVGVVFDKTKETVGKAWNSTAVTKIKDGTTSAYGKAKNVVTDKEARNEAVQGMKTSIVSTYETVKDPEFRKSISTKFTSTVGLSREQKKDEEEAQPLDETTQTNTGCTISDDENEELVVDENGFRNLDLVEERRCNKDDDEEEDNLLF